MKRNTSSDPMNRMMLFIDVILIVVGACVIQHSLNLLGEDRHEPMYVLYLIGGLFAFVVGVWALQARSRAPE